MRDVSMLMELEDVKILWQYLYMDENNHIVIDNGITKLEIRMEEDCSFHAKNLSFPDSPDLAFTSAMTIQGTLYAIEQLKSEPPLEIKSFSSRWDEIRQTTLATMALNRT